MTQPPSPRVTLHVWRIPARRLPRVLWRLARDRGALRRTPGVRFAKILGTGRGQEFRPTGADLTRWAALVVSDGPDLTETQVGRAWNALASAYCRIDLRTLTARGRWAGSEPFPGPTDPASREQGQVLALTRARLRPTRALRFWRAIGPAGTAARHAPGLLATFGVGEAPVGWQGTISLWRSARDLVEFAYRHPDHRRVIEDTPKQGWYAEELFARFDVLGITGDRDVIGWHEDVTQHEGAAVRIVPWTPHDLTRRLDDVIGVYGNAMGYPPDLLATRRGYMASHVHRRAFRAVASLDTEGTLLGFGYGYASEPGQWWHDQVKGAIPRDQRAPWLADCFEVVELHVLPGAQGHGLGAAQLRALLAMASAKTTLLSTPEAPEDTSRAWRLYRRFGFVDVVRNFMFPGDARPFAVLGRTLPLDS